MFKCKYCGQEFESKQKLGGHVTHCKMNPNYDKNKLSTNNIKNVDNSKQEKQFYICKWCGKEFYTTKSGITFHENRCIKNPNRKIHPGNHGHTIGYTAWNKGLTSKDDERVLRCVIKLKQRYDSGELEGSFKNHKHSDETKYKLSLKQQKYLQNNPEKHVWKRSTKFISQPCEYLKAKLRENNINFIEEYTPLKNRFFSIDIAWPDKKIGIEINGNQHYNNDGTLKTYYDNRHKILENNGWKIYEIHYTKCYTLNIENFDKLIKDLEIL